MVCVLCSIWIHVFAAAPFGGPCPFSFTFREFRHRPPLDVMPATFLSQNDCYKLEKGEIPPNWRHYEHNRMDRADFESDLVRLEAWRAANAPTPGQIAQHEKCVRNSCARRSRSLMHAEAFRLEGGSEKRMCERSEPLSACFLLHCHARPSSYFSALSLAPWQVQTASKFFKMFVIAIQAPLGEDPRKMVGSDASNYMPTIVAFV